MFASSSQNPFSHSMETFFKQSYTNDQNPNSTQEETPFITNFTSPSLYDHEWPLSEILPRKNPLGIDHADVDVQNGNPKNNSRRIDKNNNMSMANETGTTIPALMQQIPLELRTAKEAPIQPKPSEVKPSRRRNLDMTPRKRTGKKDRHSKICTAQGIRDRRMRLSLHIARKFFDLQDMLGFDKASKTIEWLFSKSKKAIKELQENVPETKYSSSSEEESELQISEHYEVVSNFVHAKESRHKARARARERTKEKMIINSLEENKHLYESNPNCLDQLGFFSPLEITLEESTSCNKKSSSQEADSNSIEHQFANVDKSGNYPDAEIFKQLDCPFFDYQSTCEIICHSSVITDGSSNRGEVSQEQGYNYPCSVGFLGNWDNNSFKINSSNGGIMDMVSQAGNSRASTCFATSRFPFQL